MDCLLDLSGLSPEELAAVMIRVLAAGNVQVELRGEITPAPAERLEGAVPESLRPVLGEQVAEYHISRGQVDELARRERFAVPRLCVYLQGELELAEHKIVLDAASWSLLDCPRAGRFPLQRCGQDVRVRHGRRPRPLPVARRSAARAAAYRGPVDGQRPGAVARPGAAPARPPAGGPAKVAAECGHHLMDRKRFDLPALARAKFILVRALGDKIRTYQETAAKHGYNDVLFGPQAAVETSYVYEFRYDLDIYSANSFCRSGDKWQAFVDLIARPTGFPKPHGGRRGAAGEAHAQAHS